MAEDKEIYRVTVRCRNCGEGSDMCWRIDIPKGLSVENYLKTSCETCPNCGLDSTADYISRCG